MFELVVVADENDADYLTEITKISQDDLNKFIVLMERVKKRTEASQPHYHNWENGERGNPQELYPDWTEEEIEFFETYLPYSEYGLHTIKSAEYYSLPAKVKLF